MPKAIEDAKIIGHKYLVLGYLPEEERRSLDDYKKLDRTSRTGRAKNAAKPICNSLITITISSLKRWTAKLPYDLILAETDAQKVKMELDLYWITKAGFDPLAYFEKHPGRFPLVHVKDMDDAKKVLYRGRTRHD